MALIRALNTGISGLRAQQERTSVIGNNIANVDTVGFKQARVNFETMLSQTVHFGTAPQGNLGGIDPMQIGLGTLVGSVDRDFSRGSLEATGLTGDLAIEDSGELASSFFVLTDESGAEVYSRDGSFGINPLSLLHNPSNGYIVQGWMADFNTFTIVTGGPTENISVPVGDLRIARETDNATFDGNLNGSGDTATAGTVLESEVLYSDAGVTPALLATLLTDLQTATTDLNLSIGDVITLDAEKGSRTLPAATFTVGDPPPTGGSTLADLIAWVEDVMGINSTAANQTISAPRINPVTLEEVNGTIDTGTTYTVTTSTLQNSATNFSTAGVQVGDFIRLLNGDAGGQIVQIASLSTTTNPNDTLNFSTALTALPVTGDMFAIHEAAEVSLGGVGAGLDSASAAGVIRISGNSGVTNALTNLEITGDGAHLFQFSTTTEAAGESTRSNVLVYDSLGTPRTVELTFVKQGTTSTGNQFRWFAESEDNFGNDRVVGSGLVSFDLDGQYLSNPVTQISIDLTGTGADPAFTFDIDMTGVTGFSQDEDANGVISNLSDVAMIEQDGFKEGTMIDWGVGADGVITGIFSNGQTRTIGQIVLARFANPDGLLDQGGNVYTVGVNSGMAITGSPGEFGRGVIQSGYLEESNVDLAYQFTELIVSQRAFQANARTITTADQMLQELVNLI